MTSTATSDAFPILIPPKPCQEVLDAIPAELKPYLEGFQLTGTFKTDLRLAIDWADLQATVLDGSVGIMKCKAKKAPDDVMRLAEPFEHYVEVEQDQWVSFMVGPENPDFVPITEVSPYLLNSLMTTEDSSFYKHHGFITREFKSALIKNLEAGYFKYGASSITMQLVKNVLLYREKTLARKFQELFLTWFVETKFDKDRLFEIYVNVIEYGPGIYGFNWWFNAIVPGSGGKRAWLRELTRRPLTADAEELARNPRARSARLRAAERIGEGAAS